MAGFDCIAAVGLSLERLLNACFREENPLPPSQTQPRAVLIRTEDLQNVQGTSGAAGALRPPAVSLYTYRVDFNKATRAGWSAVGSVDGRAHLPLDVHFLLTAWASNAEYELRLLGRAMQCLETHPILTGPLLAPATDWAPGESVQVVMEEVSTEAVMRTYDSLPHDYKLSVPYIARVVRLDGRRARPRADVEEVLVEAAG